MYSTSEYDTSILYAESVDVSLFAMIERAAMEFAIVNIPNLARMTGLSPHTIRSVLVGRRRLRRPNRRKLAAALRAHSANLASLADQLEAH